MSISRREFGKSAAGLASLVSGVVRPEMAVSRNDTSFPKDFLWGSATASYQVEGAVHEDGRGPSIWDTFAHTPGKTFNGDTGDVATDSYHRYKEDIALMKSLGLTACRFSIAWPRIFPAGTGAANSKGVDFYQRYVDELHSAGIQPFCTLYHWDLPQAMQDRGGWQSKDTSKAFADYAGYMARQFGDRVSHYMTMNEMASFIDNGYGRGTRAPGVTLTPKDLAQTKHWTVYGHGLAVAAVRAEASKAEVGSAENARSIVPILNTPAHIEAARKAIVEENASYLTALHTGKYTDGYLARLGPDAPVFTPEEMKVIGAHLDFQGLNIYSADFVRADDNASGYSFVPRTATYPRMASPWLAIVPESLYWTPKLIAESLKIKKIYITENGCSAEDIVSSDGAVYDVDRVMFLQAYITQLQRAVAEGVPIAGYFLWSLLDNFEWADGYSKRFGIVYVDFGTQRRTMKLSGQFYKNLIAAGLL